MTGTPRQREEAVRRARQWQERVERAAELTRERTGVPVEPLAFLGGLWAPLEAVEAWLGIDSPATPPPPGHQHEAWQIQDGANGRYCAACGKPVE